MSDVSEPIIDEYGRPEPPLDGGEVATLVGFLDYHRATFEWKCRGLTDDQLRAGLPSTRLTLGGMLKHLARVEDHWFGEVVAEGPKLEPWASLPEAAEWADAAETDGATLRRLWADRVANSRAVLNTRLAAGSAALDVGHPAWGGQGRPSLRLARDQPPAIDVIPSHDRRQRRKAGVIRITIDDCAEIAFARADAARRLRDLATIMAIDQRANASRQLFWNDCLGHAHSGTKARNVTEWKALTHVRTRRRSARAGGRVAWGRCGAALRSLSAGAPRDDSPRDAPSLAELAPAGGARPRPTRTSTIPCRIPD